MKLLFIAAIVTMALLAFAVHAQQPTQGIRTCTTSTSGSIAHEMCTFTPLIVQVQAPPVTVAPPAVTVQPAPVVVVPSKPAPPPEKPIKQ